MVYARIIFIVCPRCGIVLTRLSTEPPVEKCPLCKNTLSKRGKWLSEVKIFKMNEARERDDASARIAEEFFVKRGGEIRFTMKDGRICVVRMIEYPYYEIETEAGGEPVKMIFIRNEVLNAVKLLESEGKVYMPGLVAIEVRGCRYSNVNQTVNILVRAVEEDVKPSIMAVIK